MLKSKKELTDFLKKECERFVFSKKLNETVEQIEQENNVPTGIITDIISGRTDIENDSDFLLFLILNKIKQEKVSEFFTESEVNYYKTQQYDRGEFQFPIDIQCIQVSADQWIGAADIEFLMQLRKSQLINYNENAQRTMQRVVRGDKEIYKITLNKKAISEIKASLEAGNFIPNTITLNMPSDTDWTYDSKRNILTINSISAFDISDGYHRYMAMAQEREKNPEFNYPIELRLVCFSDEKVKQFIYQEDQKTKMRRVDSASMNMSSPANIAIERLNQDMMFDLKGKVQRNGGQIDFGYAGNITELLFFHRIKSVPMNEILTVKEKLKAGINNFVEAYPEWFEKKFDFKDTLILFYGISVSWTPENIQDKIIRKTELDRRIFANNVAKKSMLNAIEKL